jgi:hypothetical protein
MASSRSENQFKADLLRFLNVRSCVEHLLGADYRALLASVRRDPNQHRFLFCFDRFDTEIQKYRKDLKQKNLPDDQRVKRVQREAFWIQGPVELIDNLRSPDQYSPNQEFYKLVGPFVDFCVPLPKDRLYEVQHRRRDAVVGETNEEINWQPYELLTILRKRLQMLWSVQDEHFDKSGLASLRKRFDAMIDVSGRKLPDKSEIRVNGAIFPIDLFLNVLRHTFFRPRDIILYYARIVLAVELSHKRGQKLSPSALSRYISETTYKIVEEEFIGEFSDTFKNMQAVLYLFRGSPQVFGLSHLSGLLDGVKFQIYAEDDLVDLGKKIRFLYELGFLGVRAKEAQIGGVTGEDFDFYFFNPKIAPNLEQKEVLHALVFAIHPVFIEFLTLKLNSSSPVLLLNWEWVDDLDHME